MSKTRRLTASVTELTSFQTCRRRWYLSRLYTSNTDAPSFMFGSAVHKGLEGYFLAKMKKPEDRKFQKAAMLAYYIEHINEVQNDAAKEYGALWDLVTEPFHDLFEIARKILINYVDFDRTADMPIQPLVVERRMFFPLDPYKRNVLTMRWDVLGRTYNNMTAVVDHKTTTGHIISRGITLDLDEQMTGYAWGYWRAHERQKLVDLIIYDTIVKKIPAPIRVLKSGKLSTAKDQDTVLPILMETINQFKDDHNRFFDLISALEEKGWSNYFQREASPRNLEQLRNYEERVRIIFDEMRAAIENPKLAYPSPGPIKCPSCPFLHVCIAMEDGSDADYLLKTSYVRHGKTPWTLPPRYKELSG